LVAVSIIFFGLGVTNNAAKPDCILPVGDDGSSNRGHSSGKFIVIVINEALLLEAAIVSKMQTLAITL
jgi:hypothetical protein